MTSSSGFRCVSCHLPLSVVAGGEAACENCGSRFPERHGIVDFLGQPSGPVALELRGLAEENGVDVDRDGFDKVKFLECARVEDTGQLMDRSRGARIQYYQQTGSAYLEALGRAQIDSHMKVAEIGAERTLWNLRVISDLCDESFAVNIFFHVERERRPPAGIRRLLGDMGELPFEDSSLDMLIYSATLHHTGDIGGALREAARVLQPGGRAIVVNEPVAGAAKGLGGVLGHDRDERIHEDDVPFRSWVRAVRQSCLTPDHFVPAWFLGQVRAELPAGTRFRRLGRALAPLAQSSALADIMRTAGRIPAQAILGVPLNAVLWKRL